jgi:hypothetical protein
VRAACASRGGGGGSGGGGGGGSGGGGGGGDDVSSSDTLALPTGRIGEGEKCGIYFSIVSRIANDARLHRV